MQIIIFYIQSTNNCFGYILSILIIVTFTFGFNDWVTGELPNVKFVSFNNKKLILKPTEFYISHVQLLSECVPCIGVQLDSLLNIWQFKVSFRLVLTVTFSASQVLSISGQANTDWLPDTATRANTASLQSASAPLFEYSSYGKS